MGRYSWKIADLRNQQKIVRSVEGHCASMAACNENITAGLTRLAANASGNLNMTNGDSASEAIRKLNSTNAETISAARAACQAKERSLQDSILYYERLERNEMLSLSGGA